MKSVEVLFTPADFESLRRRDLSGAVCVVFDVLRATTTMVTALAHGASAIIPVETIPEALALRAEIPEVLLAGERDGVRIQAALSGGLAFDLGNSPREFKPELVRGKTIVMTTTNGTRALRACSQARVAVLGAFANLKATADFVLQTDPQELLLVCSGTFDEAAYEDILGAGAFWEMISSAYAGGMAADSVIVARELYRLAQDDLPTALGRGRNGRRLLGRPELHDDVAFCARRDVLNFVAELRGDGLVRVRGDRDVAP